MLTREAEQARIEFEERIEAAIRRLVENDASCLVDIDERIEDIMTDIARYAADCGDPTSAINQVSGETA